MGGSRNQDVYHSRTPHKEQRQRRMLDNEKDKGVCPDLISSSFLDVWQIVIGLNKFAKRCLLEEFI